MYVIHRLNPLRLNPFPPSLCAAMVSLHLSPPRPLPLPPTLHPPNSILPLRSSSSGGSCAARVRIGVVSAKARERLRDWSSEWNEDKPYRVSASGDILYLDEQDVVTFLDPTTDLIPINPSSYNPAVYLWKKIEDIPEERRHRLLSLITDRSISRLWRIAEKRYLDEKLAKKSSSDLLSVGSNPVAPEIWNCRSNSGPLLFPWLNRFQMVIFRNSRGTYGRILLGGLVLSLVASSFYPLYFTVIEVNEVMPTEQRCDLSCDFGNGLLDIPEFPDHFPKPAKHPWPFNDQMVIYLRHAGPGVLAGQAWQEGKDLDQVPKNFCGEIMMVKAY